MDLSLLVDMRVEYYVVIAVLVFSLAASAYEYVYDTKNKMAIASLPKSGLNSFYDIVEKNNKGEDVNFSEFKGKVIYGVNVASNCGRTEAGYALINQVAAIEGVQVLLFPCNQFLYQESGSNADIAQFCSRKGVKNAVIFDKDNVNGANTRITYTYLKEHAVLPPTIAWNFAGRFVVDKDGNAFPVKDDKSLLAAIAEMVR